MQKKIIILVFFFFVIPGYCISQFVEIKDCFDTSNFYTEPRLSGLYGLSEFVSPHPDIPININSLVIDFDTLNKYSASLANRHNGFYFIADSNLISFKCNIQTLSMSINYTQTGFEYSRDLFIDSLISSNRFQKSGNEILFYKDSVFKLSIKPYYDLIGLPFKNEYDNIIIQPIKVDTIISNNEVSIISSKMQFDSLRVRMTNDTINFEKYDLVVIKNRGIKKYDHRAIKIKYKLYNKFSDEKKSRKRIRKKVRAYKKKKNIKRYPASLARAYIDPNSNCKLKVVNMYFSSAKITLKKRWQYSGFLIEKQDIKRIDVEISYFDSTKHNR